MSRNALRDTVTLCCPLSEDEQDFAATMMQMTGITSEANLVRLGLWHLAKHLDVPVGNSIFGVRTTRGNAGQFGRGKNRGRMTQVLIDLEPRRVEDTSLEAFERVRSRLTQLELGVLVLVHAYLDATGHEDVTGGELADFSGRSILALRPRMTGCVKKGWLEKGPARASRVRGELRSHGLRPVVSLAAVARAHEKQA